MSDPPQGGFSIDSTAATPDGDVPASVGPPQVPERFALGDELGRGGMGAVFEAHEATLDRRLAVKVSLADDPVAHRRFQQEAQIAARLDHPGVVPVYELGEDAHGRPFFTMKKVGGETLTTLLRDRLRSDAGQDAPTLRRLVEVFLSTCQTVAFAHARGVVHRDIKPQNVMIGEYGEVLVVDWGLAKIIGTPEGESASAGAQALDQTGAGELLGTPAYMAPEQAKGQALTPSVDVYALGGVLYEVLTGRTPFPRASLSAALEALESDPPPPPSAVAPAPVPKDLEAVCLRCLEKSPAARYSTVDALIADVRAVLDDRPVSARRPGPIERLAKWSRRHPGVMRTAATGLTLLVASSGVFGVFISKKEEQRADEAERRLTVERGVREAAERRARASGSFRQALELQRRELPATTWLPLIDEAIELDPDFAEPRLERADGLRELHRYEEALAALDDAVRLQPTNSRAYLLRGVILRRHLNRHDEALAAFRKASQVDPGSTFAKVGRAMALVQDQRVAEVDLDELEGLAKDPTARGLWELHWARGFVFDLLDRGAESEKAFRRAAALAPRHAGIRLNHATALAKVGQHQAALEAIDESLARRPKHAAALSSRGTILIQLGRPQDAIAALDSSLLLDPRDSGTHCMRGVALLQTRKPTEALVAVERAVELDPSSGNAHLNRGIALRDLKRFPEALQAIDEAAKRAPDDWKVHATRGQLLAILRRTDEAIAAYERAGDRPAVLSGYGAFLYAAGKQREAIPVLQRALEGLPKDGTSWRYLAECLMAVKRYGEAAVAYEKCVTLKAHDKETAYRMGVSHLHAGNAKQAIPPLRWTSKKGSSSQVRVNALAFLWVAFEDEGRTLDADAVRAKLSSPPLGTPGAAILKKAKVLLLLNRGGPAVRALRLAQEHEDVRDEANVLLKGINGGD